MIELQSVERGAKEHSNRYSSYLKINPGCHFFQKFKRRSIRRPNKLSALLSVKFLGGEGKWRRISLSLLRHEASFCCVFRGARDDENGGEYIKMKTMPATVGQWRVAPRTGILEALHAFYLGGGSHRFRAFNALTMNGAIYARGIRFRVVEQRATLFSLFSRWRRGWWNLRHWKGYESSRWYTVKRIENLWMIKVVRFWWRGIFTIVDLKSEKCVEIWNCQT